MIPKNHPRFNSLLQRHMIEEGYIKGITHIQGLIAQGRGEAFDYILGEKTNSFARHSIKAAAALLLLAERPVISVNGNVAALCPESVARLSKELDAKVEVNLFYRGRERVAKIVKHLKKYGINALGENAKKKVPMLGSKRAMVEENGIYMADVVLVMLEDGDRTEMLRKMGKKVIAVDLNPLSRTAKKADITIVDNVVRALPAIAKEAGVMKMKKIGELEMVIRGFSNKKNLKEAENHVRKFTCRKK